MTPTAEPLLSIRHLKTHFFTDAGVARAVDEVSLDIPAGKTLALVGESGCGKSITALSILRLVPSPPGRIVGGEILFQGRDLLKLSEDEMRRIRGNDISMIFQEPMTSLNPTFRIGSQMTAVMQLHRGISDHDARREAVELLRRVGIPAPEDRLDDYPHQMSGGMRQRVMIAMALACDPVLLIADEPTTALDVTFQAQILTLLRSLQQERGMSVLLITHDLGIVAENADEVAIMYAGEIVEQAHVLDLYANPKHPYTVGLLNSVPRPGRIRQRLASIPGTVPSPLHHPEGCRFSTRCPYVQPLFAEQHPPLDLGEPEHRVRCWLYDRKVTEELGLPFGLPESKKEDAFK